jgi:polyamine oxidase
MGESLTDSLRIRPCDRDDAGPHCLVKGGMEQTVEYLASSIPDGVIHTNSPVELVAYSPADGVTLHLGNGDRPIRADYAIVTCSLGALKTETIKFAPPLPDEKRNVIERLCMGHYMKVLVEFPHVFWPEHGQYFGNVATLGASHQSRFRFPLVFSYLGLKGVPVLEGVLYGPSAVEASELEDEALVAALVQSLKDMFGDDIPAPTTHFVTRYVRCCFFLGWRRK